MSENEKREPTKLEQIEKRRAERKAVLAEAAAEQKAIDLEALDVAEIEHGDSSVRSVEIAFTPDLPTMAIVRTPSKPEMKRYRARVKPDKKGRQQNMTEAAIELGAACLLYPDADTFGKMVDARPGIDAQIGAAALKLAVGAEEDEGNG